MRALRNAPGTPSQVAGPSESLLAQFSAATLELNPSLSTPQFAQRLTDRASEMLGAPRAFLALCRNTAWEFAATSGPVPIGDVRVRQQVADAFAERAVALGAGIRFGPTNQVLGAELAHLLGWKNACFVPLIDSSEAFMGALCLADLPRPVSATEEQLLEALASHASVALENAHLFHRVEQSRKQWVEDFDAISDWIVVHDAKDCVLRLNRSLADRLGIPVTQAIGRRVGDLRIPGAISSPDGCPFCRDPQGAQRENVHQAGDRTYLISTSMIREPNQGEARAIHVLKDITDRLEAERRYLRERDFNRNILNNTPNMILLLDTAGVITYANRRCFEAGYQEKDLLGRHVMDMVAPSYRAVPAQALDCALQGTAVENVEIPLDHKDRGHRQFSASFSPIRDDSGAATSIVVVMTDVTDAADLQAKLMQTEKMAALGQLVSGVAHEVNNPLTAIVGFTDLLLENPAVPEAAKEELRVILEQAQRTRVIVHDLLSFARQTPPRREPLHVNAVVRQTLKLRAYDFSNHGVEVIERYEEDLPVVLGDPHQLQQVFLNIVNNAYDAVRETTKPGKIEIVTARHNGGLEITFRDNGPGISRPDRIFDPFFTTKEVGKGTGLGLSICYGIIRSHQGEIFANNNVGGVGCTFVIHLPVAAKAAELAAAERQS
ncbi:MAG TPA: ATP-binding protein [Candidatus Acidoferrum sp.]|nr:ATP-binding protein [Candidatus Acidoferrum sp.]